MPHPLHQNLVRRRQFASADGFLRALANSAVYRVSRMLALTFQLSHRQRQVAAQITAGKQFIITGVVYHVVNQRQNA